MTKQFITYKKNQIFFDNISINEIVTKNKTPFYLYSKAAIERNYLNFKNSATASGMLKNKVCFAMKSNSNIQLLRKLKALGAGCDIVSGGELKLALKAGFKGSDIVFSGVGKTAKEIQTAIKAKVYSFNVESVEELEQIYNIGKELNVRPQICFRLNPQVIAKTHKHISTGNRTHKFGILSADIIKACETKKWWKVCELKGISIHIGSQLTCLKATKKAIKNVCECAKAIPQKVEFIDVGGGLGVAYHPDQDDIPDVQFYMNTVYKELKKHYKILPEIVFEPGRVIAASAGVFVTSIVRNKKSEDFNFIIVDGGMNDFVRPSLYNAYHEIYSCKKSTVKTKFITSDIVGPICETADCFGTNRKLPAMKAGDFIVIADTGAYGYTMSSNYNMRNKPGEVIV
jgi:diaminopimelate decarboxylase